ncbi:MAG: cadherin domain-containing protein, partial [Trichodesmium sp. St7_bin2_1]|nr:cadherin domain-containing protein [Trichodesmium sp. St7_bin2_1]
MDGDGDVDVLSASRVDNKIALYETVVSVQSVSIHAAGTPTEAGATPGTFTIVDGDGDVDVLSASVNDDKIALYETFTNSPPTDLQLNNTTIPENVAPNSLVGTFSTTDPDNGDSFTYALVIGEADTDNQAFTINGDQLQINETSDYETKSSYTILVQTTDGSGASYQEQLTININDVNENSPP